MVLSPSDVLCIVNLETKKLNFKMSRVFDSSFGDSIIIVILKIRKKLKVLDLNGKPLANINYGGGLKVEHIMVYIFIIGQTKS